MKKGLISIRIKPIHSDVSRNITFDTISFPSFK